MSDTITITTIKTVNYECNHCGAKPTVYLHLDGDVYIDEIVEGDCGHKPQLLWSLIDSFPPLTEIFARIKAADRKAAGCE